ncbi:PEP-CTERM sorting domain-containing protein [Coleofasciculus sp. FACHB-1120]|uniref:PEP-CTERM sorting domain-containing protein n=1 Tax=Coleofasciculus sp. FACHB-1120 TaxID=2692783 RepID=UPI00168212BC|nr:PEP-CTERM sorting domain-containing protein [Coleofasciculus sp. FACHB-1120]MBD2743738.1 PEP-CTERM sorting domain-containing protein [Coleofasciculus sp. FACHB-1120]
MAPRSIQAATLTTLTFNELPTQPVDDLSFKGVTFDFKVDGIDSTAATYNVVRTLDLSEIAGRPPGTILYNLDLSPPVLATNAPGILTLDFTMPTAELMFDVASLVNFQFQPMPTFTIELFNEALSSISIQQVLLDEDIIDVFPSPVREAVVGKTFAYNGTSVKRAVIDFSNTGSVGFDNLTYQAATQTASVPEPGSGLGLLALGALGATSRLKRKQKK